ncbi:MAG: amino acid permease [Coxiellaceae bacterium]|nr:amino acid permease [Coxiellaceae bacterium]
MNTQQHLHKALTPLKLWALMVGMVISGQYFGWSYGVGLITQLSSFFYGVFLVVIFYTGLTLTCAELASFIPSSGGPSEYATHAFGPRVGAITGWFCLLEFLFAVPAIAVSMGHYMHLLVPAFSSKMLTFLVLVLVLAINCFKVENMARIELVATILALCGLVVFYVVGGHYVQWQQIKNIDHSLSFTEVMHVIPFAIWLFLAIEGGVMTAEELQDPTRTIIKGFIAALVTLIICTLATVTITMFLSGQLAATTDSPLPSALLQIPTPTAHFAASLVVILGLFGLFASLNGITMAYSRQVFAMSRAHHLPKKFSRLSARDIPTQALLVPGVLAIILAMSATIAKWLVTVSVLGAVLMYLMIFASLFVLRRREANAERQFRVPLPLAAVSMLLGALFLVAILMSLFF